jgi:hypothetical protein
MFDDDDGISEVAEAGKGEDEAFGVAGMEADTGFIEDEEGMDESGAETGGEVDSLGFTAGKGAGGSVEGQVAEADLDQEAESGADLFEGEGEGVMGGGVGAGGKLVDQFQGVGDGQGVNVGEGEGLGRVLGVGKEPEQGIGLEPAATAGGAGSVGAIAGEEHADVHFVGFGFEPFEVAADAVPGVGPFVAMAVVGVAFEDPALVFRGQVTEGDMQGDSGFTGEAGEISQGFGAGTGLPGFNGALGEREGAIGNGEVIVDGDDATEAFAFRAGAEGMVEAEEGGGRRGVFEVAGGAVQVLGEGSGGEGRGGGKGDRDEGEAAMAEVVGLFASFDEAVAVAREGAEAVEDDSEVGWGG